MSWLVPSLPSWGRLSSSPAPKLPGSSSSADPPTEESDLDLDLPPAFPALNSAQRSAPSSAVSPTFSLATSSTLSPTISLAPPSPPRPFGLNDYSEEDGPNPTHLANTVPGDMAPPPSTTSRPRFGMQVGGDTSGPSSPSLAPGAGAGANVQGSLAVKKSRKVALGPGCSALDWARLTQSGEDLRGLGKGMGMLRVTPEELAKHKTKADAWSAFNGRVYNLSAYLRFHPGGEAELMRAAGRDGTKLFMLTHSWVNAEYMLQECCIGMLVKT